MNGPAIGKVEALRARLKAMDVARPDPSAVLPFGVPGIDGRIGGGLPANSLHEAAAASPSLPDEAAAALFLASIAARRTGSVLWTLTRRDLFAPGLSQAGLAPDRLIYAECRRDEDVLAVMEEALRHGGLAAIVGEAGRATMTATRRLQLAAEEGGTMALLLRCWRRTGSDPLLAPSVAMTRWRIAAAPSGQLPVPGVGRLRWRLELARCRGGHAYHWIVEAPDAQGRIALPAVPVDRQDQARRAQRTAS